MAVWRTIVNCIVMCCNYAIYWLGNIKNYKLMKTEARFCGLQDKNSYDCHGRMGRYCEDCNMIIETVIDLPECRLCDNKHCIQAGDIVGTFRNEGDRVMDTYEGKLDNCSFRRYTLSKL